MHKYFTILCAFHLLVLTCAAQSDCKLNYIRARYASYSDSTYGYLFCFDETKNAFEYRIYNHANDSLTRIYCGIFKTVADTLYLNYRKGKPTGVKPFLIREFSGNYYIQYFDNGTRKFLWKRPRMGYGS
jgi:hypothetical protein